MVVLFIFLKLPLTWVEYVLCVSGQCRYSVCYRSDLGLVLRVLKGGFSFVSSIDLLQLNVSVLKLVNVFRVH